MPAGRGDSVGVVRVNPDQTLRWILWGRPQHNPLDYSSDRIVVGDWDGS